MCISNTILGLTVQRVLPTLCLVMMCSVHASQFIWICCVMCIYETVIGFAVINCDMRVGKPCRSNTCFVYLLCSLVLFTCFGVVLLTLSFRLSCMVS